MQTIEEQQLEIPLRQGLINNATWDIVEAQVWRIAKRMQAASPAATPADADVQGLLDRWRARYP